MTTDTAEPARETKGQPRKSALVYRQSIFTRLTHWVWVVCLFFLLFSGLQIFNAHPTLYIGNQSGFEFDNTVLSMSARRLEDGRAAGFTEMWGHEWETTGYLGLSGEEGDWDIQGFPSWMTIPSYRDLATGRVVHFFFAWVLVGTLAVWLIASIVNGHIKRDLAPGPRSLKALPRDIWNHLRFKFGHGPKYNALQRYTYAGVLFVLFPLMILTGLSMSPGMNASWPWLLDLFGGRQTARTIHFAVMVLLVAFFFIHILMVVLAGPINEMRSMITGWYRTDREKGDTP